MMMIVRSERSSPKRSMLSERAKRKWLMVFMGVRRPKSVYKYS